MKFNSRTESAVFADIAHLATQPGYVYAIAQICNRDNLVAYKDEYKASDLSHLFNSERLIRTEITTLLGLMMHKPLSLTAPTIETVQAYIARTDELMKELHYALNSPQLNAMQKNIENNGELSELWSGPVMREPIFYAAESAYVFQYRDFFVEKHRPDNHWLQTNKGFTCEQAVQVARTMCLLMDERATATLKITPQGVRHASSTLSQFEFTPEEITQQCGLDIEIVRAFFQVFTLTQGNSQFNELGNFNAVTATPLLPTDRGSVLLFQHYSIFEAMYESPFFWMMNDKDYKQTAMLNRGAFAEEFSSRRLTAVFGEANVHKNVNIYQGKEIACEADVLIIYGDRIIIIQAKAKKLTLEARKGNDGKLKSDFTLAIQNAYDQAAECAKAMVAGNCRLLDSQGKEIFLPEKIKEIYPFCVVSDHYPALAFQASQYLKYQITEVLKSPYVIDVFLLDVLAEMLDSPLRFLSYVRLRIEAGDKLFVNHELTALAYHLNQNLWLNPKFNMVMLEDSVTNELDAAMTVRREGFPGQRTPPGILTKMAGTFYEKLITKVERQVEPKILELGFVLLSLDEETCFYIHHGIAAIISQAKSDGQRHDFVIGVKVGDTGICFHCNPSPDKSAIETLRLHCHKRKYSQRSSTWFGVSLSPNADIQFGLALDFPWVKTQKMDQLTKDMKVSSSVKSALKAFEKKTIKKKLGRNDPCPCKSEKKYKKCCGFR